MLNFTDYGEKVLNDAIMQFGYYQQIEKVKEELLELLLALQKKDKWNIQEEIADSYIMLNQLAFFYGYNEITKIIDNKIRRLEDRINEKKEKKH